MRSLSLRSEEHTSELQSRLHLVCRLLLVKKTEAMSRAYTSRLVLAAGHLRVLARWRGGAASVRCGWGRWAVCLWVVFFFFLFWKGAPPLLPRPFPTPFPRAR